MKTTVHLELGIRRLLNILPLISICIMFLTNEFDWSVAALIVLVCMWLASMKLDLEITEEYFKYKLVGWHMKEQQVELTEVDKAEIFNATPLSDFLGWGIRYNPKYGLSFIMQSGSSLHLITKAGKKRTFSLGKDPDFERELRAKMVFE